MSRKWGSIRRRGKDSWEVRYPSLRDNGMAGKAISETVHGTKQDAESILVIRRVEFNNRKARVNAMQKAKLKGLAYVDVPDTVDQIWTGSYLPYARERMKSESMSESTLAGYESIYKNHIGPNFGSRPINSILHAEVQQYLKDLTHPQAKHVVSVMRLLWNFAASENGGYVIKERNIMTQRFDYPPKNKKQVQISHDVYSPEELDELLAGFKGHVIEPYVILMGVGGARAGEACGVMPGEIKFEHFKHPHKGCDVLWGIVPLKRTVIKVNGVVTIKNSLKTQRSRRELFIPEPYSIRLKELADSCNTPFFTENINGLPLSPADNSWMWRDWFKTHSLKYIPMKNLRNTHASILLAQGYSEELVMRLLGHTTLTMLHEHYDRRTGEMLIGQLMDNTRANEEEDRPPASAINSEDISAMVRLMKKLGLDEGFSDSLAS